MSSLVKHGRRSCEGRVLSVLRFSFVCALVAIVLLAENGVAQEPTLKVRTKEQRDREFMARHRVNLNVQVADGSGNPITDLRVTDFTLLDNKQPRKIAAFHYIDGQALNDATEVLIVLDAVNSTAQELETERQGIFKYLASKHGPLPYRTRFALWWNGHLTATPAVTDRDQVGKGFVKLTKGVHSNACETVDGSVQRAAQAGGAGAVGHSGIGERAVTVAQCLEVHFKDSLAALDGIADQQAHLGGRTLLIWVGPGWPLLSGPEFQRMSPKAQETMFDEIVTVLRDLREAQVTVDAISPRDGTREAELARVDAADLMAGTTSSRSAIPAGLALPVLARQTGGLVNARSSDVMADLTECIHDADGYYAFSFEADPAANGAVQLHSIDLKVNRPGAKVRTMTTYYAEK